MRVFPIHLLLPALLLLCCGCGETIPTPAESLDAQIDETWMQGRQRMDAIAFFREGGVYSSTPQFPDVDSRIVVPLVEQLQDECGLTVEVLQEGDRPSVAFAVVADISTVEDRSKIATICRNADHRHPELVLENWGDRWLSIDILDESVTSHLNESGELQPLVGHVERLRTQFGATPAEAD